MDWSELGEQIADMAPTVGAALAGPAGDRIGTLIASEFGTGNQPEEIDKAVKEHPEAATKLKGLETRHKDRMEELALEAAREVTRSQSNANPSIHEDYRKGAVWRRAVGWSFAGVAVVTVVGVMALAGLALYQGDVQMLKALPGVFAPLSALFYAYLAVLGISSWQEGKMGRVLSGEREGGLSKAIKAMKG